MSAEMNSSLKVVIAGGGTGGHVFPALAIKQAIVQKVPDAQVIFAGTSHGIEAVVMPREHEELKLFWISGFSRSHMARNLLLPFKLMDSFVRSFAWLSAFKPQIVIGTGGYVMGPVLWTAQRLGIPTLLQEQNSFPGYTTRRLAPKATVVCAGFEDAKKRLPGARVEVTGNPLRASFRAADRAAAKQKWNLDPTRPTLLVFGGSAGARSINEAVASALPALNGSFNLIWQTGKLGVPSAVSPELTQAATSTHQLIVLEFIEDMASAYAACDLAVCRAGAMTLAELAMSATPAILIPYPFATDDHQRANAEAVEAQGAAAVIADSALNPDLLMATLKRCTDSPSLLSSMSTRMASLARPEAAARIAEIALSIVRKP
jgi:UDP-N-acetylglucosamine--N-acetylmuramyl-(pentapeptide) pyrophosphoryl-undecaprenol N-acetylglucosamine transferase